MNLYLRLMSHTKKYWLEIVAAIICMTVVALSNVAIIPIVGALSKAIGSMDFRSLNIIILWALGLYFVKGIFMYGQVYFSAFVAQGMVRDIRIKLFEHVQLLSLDFFAKWRTGEILSRVTNDISMMQTATVSSFTEIVPNIISLCGIFAYLMYLNWKLSLLSLVILPIIFYTVTKFGREMRSVSGEAQMKVADIASIIQEVVSNIRIVKSFTMEERETDRFARESDRSFWISLKEAAIHATQTPLLAFIQALAIVAVVWYGGFEVVSGNLAASNLIAFFTGIALLADPIAKLSNMNVLVQRALASTQRVFEVMDIEPTVKDKAGAAELGKAKGAVELRDVSFQYEPNETHALKNISVKVRPGEVIALVGPSGSGKSTFANLIPRFYDPDKGEVLIDNINIKDRTMRSLREQIGIVPQETQLFSGTIKDNIAYGKPDATNNEIISAAKAANAHDFIMATQKGYDTPVGERGLKLSGGQRQRIAIARAVLRNPRILILDEATSSLDTESERLVQDALEHLMKGRTTFVIAHRLSTVQIADRILVLKGGSIVEEGSHKELLQTDGIYKRLYEMQFRDETGQAKKPK